MQRLPISLCMIVKDEAEHLPRCLHSVDGIADEIIVVDTGSADDTVGIAESFGARVIRSPWRNDFAFARNAGLDAATGYWILFLDADEEIDAADRDELIICAQHPEYAGFFVQIHNYIGADNTNVSINPVLRMFRNAPEHRFEGRIHEQISASIFRHTPNSSLHMSGVKIHHCGYKNEMVAKKDKLNRNMQLLLRALEESPDDSFHLYNIGVEYLRSGQNEQALHAFRRSRTIISPEMSYVHLIYKSEVRCLQMLKRHMEAVEICAAGMELFPEYTDLMHAKGIGEMTIGRIKDARISLFAAYHQGPPPAGYHTESGMGTYYTAYALGLLHESMQDYRPSVRWYMEAISSKPGWAAPLYRLFRLMKCRGAESELASILERQFSIDAPEAAAQLLAALLVSNCRLTVSLLLESWKNRLAKADWAAAFFAIKLLDGDVDGVRRLLRRKAFAGDRSIDLIRERMKGWVRWIRSSQQQLALPKEATPGEWPFAIKLAAACGNAPAALSLTGQWKERLASPGQWDLRQAQSIARAYALLADSHLEKVSGSSESCRLVLGARLEAPYEDGC
jgi:tetratricopeptide (TPR) repeat protein